MSNRFLINLGKDLRGLIFSLVLFLSLIGINGLQVLTLLVRPFSGRLFRRLNRELADTWWGWCVLGGHYVNRSRILVTGDALPECENAIVILNHQGMVDIPVVMSIARRKKRLGDLKWYVKASLKYLPGIGWGMQFLDCLFVKRNWTDDSQRIARVFRNLTHFSIPCWVINFVEGTRKTTEKLQSSQAYARDHNLAPLAHVLVPRTKGFVATVKGLGEHFDAVYDFTVGYFQEIPSLWQWIRGDVKKVHLHVRRFARAQLPNSDDLSTWLQMRFQEKDRLLSSFYTTGSF